MPQAPDSPDLSYPSETGELAEHTPVGSKVDAASSTPRAKHSNSLDGWRLFGFLFVFLDHVASDSPDYENTFNFTRIVPQLFFVLSGFLIGGILLKQKEDTSVSLIDKLKTFYSRRFLRIFPLYYAMIAMIVVGHHFNWDWVGPKHTTWYLIFFLANVKEVLIHDFIGAQTHLWSLSVEESFYLIAPLVILLAPRKALKWLFVTIWVGCAVVRWFIYKQPEDWLNLLSPMQFDALTIGIAAAMIARYGNFFFVNRRRLSIIGGIGGIITTIILELTTYYPDSMNDSICETALQLSASFAMAAFVLGCWEGKMGIVGKFLSLAPIAYLGRITYGMYIFHNYAIDICWDWDPLGDRGIFAVGVGALVLTIVFAIISWHFFEKPINDLKRFVPTGKPQKKAILEPEHPASNVVHNHNSIPVVAES